MVTYDETLEQIVDLTRVKCELDERRDLNFSTSLEEPDAGREQDDATQWQVIRRDCRRAADTDRQDEKAPRNGQRGIDSTTMIPLLRGKDRWPGDRFPMAPATASLAFRVSSCTHFFSSKSIARLLRAINPVRSGVSNERRHVMFPFRPVFFSAALLAASFSTAARTAAQAGIVTHFREPDRRFAAGKPAGRTHFADVGSAVVGRLRRAAPEAVFDQRHAGSTGARRRRWGADSPVSACDVSNVVLEDAIELVLRQLDLTVMVRDEVLVITTQEEAENTLETHVYPVADLLGVGRSARDVGRGRHDDYDTLLETITSIIAPDTWDQVGGAGSIEAFPASLPW